ncbi:hypothetical protein ACHQM5_030898 [Ranunculus cassubicifolius]
MKIFLGKLYHSLLKNLMTIFVLWYEIFGIDNRKDIAVILDHVKPMAGELSAAELENLMTIVANPRQFKIPDWFLNRKKDYKDGRYSQVVSNALDMKLRDDLERLKKIRNHRGLRHYWGLRVRPRLLDVVERLLVFLRSDKLKA